MGRVRIDFPEQVLFSHEIEVRISDLNYGKHLGHDNLIGLLHEARAQLFRHLGVAEDDVDGHAMVIVDLAVRYLSEAFFLDRLRVDMAVGDMGSHRLELRYRVVQQESEQRVAEAQTGVVFVDPAARQVVEVPRRLRHRFTGDRDDRARE